MKLLDPLIAAALKSGQSVLNLSKDQYQLQEQQVLTKPFHLIGNGSTLIAPVKYSAFDCHANNIVVEGFNCSKSNIFFHVNAGVSACQLNNCILSDVENAVKGEDGCGPVSCTNVLCGWDPITQKWVTGSSSVTFYGTLNLTNCKGRSTGEYAIRLEGRGYSIIKGGEYTNNGNAFGKDTVGARNGDGEFDGVIIHGNIRVGQEPPSGAPLPMGSASKLKISKCTFMDQSPGHTYVEIKQGCQVWEWDNIWKTAKEPNFAPISAGSVLDHNPPR